MKVDHALAVNTSDNHQLCTSNNECRRKELGEGDYVLFSTNDAIQEQLERLEKSLAKMYAADCR